MQATFRAVLANKHEPFNRRFQTDDPVVCYLFEESRILLQNNLDIVSKKEVPRSSA